MTAQAMFPNQITIHNQDVRTTGVAIADSVGSAQDSWLVIYRSPKFCSTEIVGYAPVRQGLNRGVKVPVNIPLIGDHLMLFAVLHAGSDTSIYSCTGLFE